MLKIVDKKEIIKVVTTSISKSKKEILATMLLAEEIRDPLPASYYQLIKEKVKRGVVFKRVGFGIKDDFETAIKRIGIIKGRYLFKYIDDVFNYQRLIIIDEKKLFFGAEGMFFQTDNKILIKIFKDYFNKNFKRGK